MFEKDVFVMNSPIPGVTGVNLTDEDIAFLSQGDEPQSSQRQTQRVSREGGLPVPAFNFSDDAATDEKKCDCKKVEDGKKCDCKKDDDDMPEQNFPWGLQQVDSGKGNNTGHDGPHYAPPMHVTKNMQKVSREGGLPLPGM